MEFRVDVDVFVAGHLTDEAFLAAEGVLFPFVKQALEEKFGNNWFTKAQERAGQDTAPHMRENVCWDMYAITAVLRGYFHDVFQGKLKHASEMEASDVFTQLLRLISHRNYRAHFSNDGLNHVLVPAVRVSLDAMLRTQRLLVAFGLGVPQGLQDALAVARLLFQAARRGGRAEDRVLQEEELKRFAAYILVSRMEGQICHHAGSFEYNDNGISFGNRPFEETHRDLIKEAQPHFANLAKLRKSVYHRGDTRVTHQNIRLSLEAILIFLTQMHPFPPPTDVPNGWSVPNSGTAIDSSTVLDTPVWNAYTGVSNAPNVGSSNTPNVVIDLTMEKLKRFAAYILVSRMEGQICHHAGSFEYNDNGISFGNRPFEETHRDLIKEAQPHFANLAKLRKSVYHRGDTRVTHQNIRLSLEAILIFLTQMHPFPPPTDVPNGWSVPNSAAIDSSTVLDTPVWNAYIGSSNTPNVVIDLTMENVMHIPLARTKSLVGRSDAIEKATVALTAHNVPACVVVSGLPGVGKDVVAVAVASDERVKRCTGVTMQGWLKGSTEQQLKRDLIEVFQLFEPTVAPENFEDEVAVLEAIKRWLRDHEKEWLFVVEDCVEAALKRMKDLGLCGAGAGRVLLTTQSPAIVDELRGKPGFAEVHLGVFSTRDSILLLRELGTFKQLPRNLDVSQTTEDQVQKMCSATVQSGDLAVTYIGPPPNEKNNKARLRKMLGPLQEHNILSPSSTTRPILEKFLEKKLGNLPLAVRPWGVHVKDVLSTGATSVEDEIRRFNEISVPVLETRGRDPITSTHFEGLYRTVVRAVSRLEAFSGEMQTHAGQVNLHVVAINLLLVMAVLDPSQIPGMLLFHPKYGIARTLESPQTDGWLDVDMPVYHRWEAARKLLQRVGLISVGDDSLDGSYSRVGTVHEMIQQCVRELFCGRPDCPSVALDGILSPERVEATIAAVRRALYGLYDYDGDPATYRLHRALEPSVAHWLDTVTWESTSAHDSIILALKPVEDGKLLLSRADFLREFAGDAFTAESLHRRCLELRGSLPADDVHVTESQAALALTLTQMGKNEEALGWQIAVLATTLRRFALPENIITALTSLSDKQDEALESLRSAIAIIQGPPKGIAAVTATMVNLASTLSRLGQVEKALEFQKSAIDKRLQVPLIDKETAKIKINYATTLMNWGQLEKLEEAVSLHISGLEILRETLPPGHPEMAETMLTFATMLRSLGKSGDPKDPYLTVAYSYGQSALEQLSRELPPIHRTIALAKMSVASTLQLMKKFKESKEFAESALRIMESVAGQRHSDTANAMVLLAFTLSGLEQPAKALELESVALEILQEALLPGHADLEKAKKNLGCTLLALAKTLKNDQTQLLGVVVLLFRRFPAFAWENCLDPKSEDLSLGIKAIHLILHARRPCCREGCSNNTKQVKFRCPHCLMPYCCVCCRDSDRERHQLARCHVNAVSGRHL